jgi:hypothetical protein
MNHGRRCFCELRRKVLVDERTHHHKNDEQYEHDIDERCHVDLGRLRYRKEDLTPFHDKPPQGRFRASTIDQGRDEQD